MFGDTIERFTAALGRALPHLDRKTLDARYVFVSGAVISAVECRGPTVLEPAAAIPDLVRFLAAGMRAAVDSSEIPLSPARQTP